MMFLASLAIFIAIYSWWATRPRIKISMLDSSAVLFPKRGKVLVRGKIYKLTNHPVNSVSGIRIINAREIRR